MRLWVRRLTAIIMDEYRLLRQCSLKRALADTWRLRGNWCWFICVEILGVFIFSALATLKRPDTSMLTTAIYAGSGGVSGVLIPFLIILLVNFIRSPYLQRDEARRTLEVMLDENIESNFTFDQRLKWLYLQVRNVGKRAIVCSGKMIGVNYTNEGKQGSYNNSYDLLWEENSTNGELKLKTLSPSELVLPFVVARLDGVTTESIVSTQGRGKEYGDGVNLLLQRLKVSPTRLIVDLDSVVEFEMRIYVNG